MARLFTSFNVPVDGNYVFRVKAYQIPSKNGPPHVNLEVDDKVLKTVDVLGIGYGAALFYEVPVTLEKGKHKVAVHWPAEVDLDLPPATQPAKTGDEAAEPVKAPKAVDNLPALDAAKPSDAEKGGEAADALDVPKPAEPTPAKSDAVPLRSQDPQPAKAPATVTYDEPPGMHIQWFELAHSLGPTSAEKKVLAHADGLSPHDAAKEVLGRFIASAFRRPAAPAEVDRYVKLVDDSIAAGENWEGGVRLAIEAVLCSPKFVYRAELDQSPDSKDPHPIDDYQLASRLSYFLWSTMPDSELLELASKNQLHENLEAQTRRMLKDPRSHALTENFASQWLQIRQLRNVAPDQKMFPQFDDQLRASMMEETQRFFDAIIQEDRNILDLIDSDFTFLNQPLAKLYGIVDDKGNRVGQEAKEKGAVIRGARFVRVQLQPGDRGGILTQASILTITSNSTRTSPVKRGKWVMEQVLGTPPPPPPPDVPQLAEGEKAALTGSLRHRMEQHRADPGCASCHARMDPIGFAFENFDAIGKQRTKDGDFDIDPAGVLPGGQSFDGPHELKTILKSKGTAFSRCLTQKLMVYALGRGLEYRDRPTVEQIVHHLADDQYRFSSLVVGIVQSDAFRLRRGKDLQND